MATTFINRGHFFAPHVKPVLIDCNFTVSATDTGGLGIVAGSLKGQGVQNIFMHTTATPGKGPNGKLNPNPAAGYILVQLADNYYQYYGGFSNSANNLSGSSLVIDATALTIGGAFVITAVGTSTAADWLAVGVPPGVIPAVGVAFIAIATGSGSGSGTVQAPATTGAGITDIVLVGNPSIALAPIPVGGSPNVGGWLVLQCLGATNSTTTTLIPTAPTLGTNIELAFYMSQSTVKVAGE